MIHKSNIFNDYLDNKVQIQGYPWHLILIGIIFYVNGVKLFGEHPGLMYGYPVLTIIGIGEILGEAMTTQ